MKTTKKIFFDNDKENSKSQNDDFAENFWGKSSADIKTMVDTAKEPFLILDEDFRVIAGNKSFYRTFHTEENDTEGKMLYDLGNGQWNIPSLQKLLENIINENTFFNAFEVSHEFPVIGQKTMLVSARRIYQKRNEPEDFPPIILFAIEDVTEIMDVAETLSRHTKEFEEKLNKRTHKLEIQIEKLEKEIDGLKSG